jgi:hypothetical protein
MTTKTLLLLGVFATALSAADGAPSVASFQKPPDEFRPVPFWGWTGDINRDQIRRQMLLMREQNLTTIMLYPRFGLEVEYFSEEYVGLVKYAVEQARQMGIRLWLYDEYTWPSGTAGKRIPREYPQYRTCSLRVFQHYVSMHDRRRRVDLRLPPDVFRVVAVNGNGEKIRITPEGDVVRWSAPPGAWRVYVSWVHRDDQYVDTMDPAVTRKFIELTYEGYRKAVGQSFGSTIIGIFGDEPVMFHDTSPGRWNEYDVKAFPWTGRMPEAFRTDHGYDIGDMLPELLQPGGVRRDLWATATRLYSDSYHRMLGEWCRKYGIAYTAHLLAEQPASALVRAEGDFFQNQRWMDVPSIDEIWTKSGFGGDYPRKKMPAWGTLENVAPGEWVAPKMAQSTAEWMGRKRTIVEVYALGPPSITLDEMRRMVNWEAVHGLNSFLLAVFPSSLRGATISTGYLPAIFYQQPWYRYYSHYSDYVARVGYLLTRGARISKTGVIYPSASYWGNMDGLDQGLNDLTKLLLQSHRDFTFVFESGLDQARGREFEAIFVPPLHRAEPALARYLRQFGDRVHYFGQRPQGVEGGQVIGPASFPIPGDLPVSSPRILIQQRQAGDATIVFAFNASITPTEATLRLPGAGEWWDPTTGKVAAAGRDVARVFEPGEGVFFVVRPGIGAAPAMVKSGVARTIPLDGPWEFRAARQNSLRLNAIDNKIEFEHLPAKVQLSLSQDLVRQARVNGQAIEWQGAESLYLDDHNREIEIAKFLRRGTNTIQLDTVHGHDFPFLKYGYVLGDFSVRDGKVVAPVREMSGPWTAAGYPEYSGTGIYAKTIQGQSGKVTLELADVAMDPVEVWLNGQVAGVRAWGPFRFDLTGKWKPGPNRLEIRITNSMANMSRGPMAAGLCGAVTLRVEAGGEK